MSGMIDRKFDLTCKAQRGIADINVISSVILRS